jgi:hypothetical protein
VAVTVQDDHTVTWQMLSWHADWQVVGRQTQWDESGCDKCHFLGKCYGATWPSRGLPRGTPPVVGKW